MKPYLELVRLVLEEGAPREDRTGVGTLSVFGVQCKYDCRAGFPLVTTKRVLFPAVVREILWFLSGSTNIRDGLTQHTPIWDAWAAPDGDVGPGYGWNWRSFGGHVDQIHNVIQSIRNDPTSRRLVVSAWDPVTVDLAALPPCHAFFQFYVTGTGHLDCHMYQRSADLALGVPFNIAGYALLMHLIANECGMRAGVLTHSIGDAHIYLNHVDGLREQLLRRPLARPTLVLPPPGKPVDDIVFEDVQIVDYDHHPPIRFPVAV